MLTRHDERWKELVRQQAPRNAAEGRSNEENPFGHRGAVDEVEVAHDPSGVQPIELERPSEQHANGLVLGGA